MRKQLSLRWAIGTFTSLIYCWLTMAGAQGAEKDVDFVQEVAPILRAKCVECHDASMQMADLRLDSREAMLDAGVIEPGDAENSLILQRLHDRDLGILMPPTGQLDKAEIDTLRTWVESGAPWPKSFVLAAPRAVVQEDGRTRAIFDAIRHDDADALQEMLRDEKLVDVRNKYGATPLMHAALYSGMQTFRLLLDQGADPNAVDNHGMSALMLAVSDPDKVRLLLAHDAQVDVQSKLGRTALLLASSYSNNTNVVKKLIHAGSDVQYADRRGWTSVVLAARTGDSELVRTLLDAGGDVNGGNAQGLSPGTPLMQAAWAGDVASARLLLARGSHGNQRSVDMALIFAATHGNLELVKLLIEAGANPQARVVTNYVPESPILAAAYSDALNVDIVKLLLKKEANVQQTDNRGKNALGIASARGQTEIVMLLRSSLADRNLDQPDSASPSIAEQDRGDESVRQIVQKSVSLLQSCGPRFYANSGCAACHQQTASALVVQLAREKGVVVDENIARQQVKLTSVDLRQKRVGFLQRMKIGGTTHRLGYLLWGLATAGYPADEITDAAYVELAGLQLRNGSWVSDAHRPPTEYSPVTATAVSLRAIQDYSPPGLKAATTKRVARATEWLSSVKAFANAEKAFRLLGLHWGGADQVQIEAAKRQLLAEQDSHGGWSQLPALEPDAYATGLTLYALHQTGSLSARDEAYRKGVDFLMSIRKDDGSWHVRTRSFAFQPYFESGFPHGHDQWISAAATGWATMALMQTLEPTVASSR